MFISRVFKSENIFSVAAQRKCFH